MSVLTGILEKEEVVEWNGHKFTFGNCISTDCLSNFLRMERVDGRYTNEQAEDIAIAVMKDCIKSVDGEVVENPTWGELAMLVNLSGVRGPLVQAALSRLTIRPIQ